MDVLWNESGVRSDLGVFDFPITCLPDQLECAQTGRRFLFWVKHVPLIANYAHSEIWCAEPLVSSAVSVVPTKLVKKELRARIAMHSNIRVEPRI